MHAKPPSPTASLAAKAAQSHWLPLVALAVTLTTVWVRPPPAVLYGTDAGCYARVAREMAERPLAQWPRVTVGGKDFFEHPPLAMWVESGMFRLLGISAASAVLLARLTSTLLTLLILAVARRMAGTRAAALCVLTL